MCLSWIILSVMFTLFACSYIAVCMLYMLANKAWFV